MKFIADHRPDDDEIRPHVRDLYGLRKYYGNGEKRNYPKWGTNRSWIRV